MSTQTTAQPKKRGAREGGKRYARLRGDERTTLAGQLRAEYDAGASIHELKIRHSLSYGLTRTLLLEAGTTLRSHRGGRKRSRS